MYPGSDKPPLFMNPKFANVSYWLLLSMNPGSVNQNILINRFGAVSLQQFQHFIELIFFSVFIGIITLIVDNIWISTMLQEDFGDRYMIVIGRIQERGLTFVVLAVDIGTFFTKEFRHRVVAVIGCVDQGSETVPVRLIDILSLGKIAIDLFDILIDGGGVDAFNAAEQQSDG